MSKILASTLLFSGVAAMPCDYDCSLNSASRYSFGSNGLDLLTAFEGFSSTCYKDSVGVWTIGYGHACQSSSDDLPQYGVECTSGHCSGTLSEKDAEQVLNDDVASFVSCVRNAVRVDVTQNMFDAMVSFAFNIGCSGFQSSTFVSELNQNKITDKEGQYQLTRWHSGCIEGLERRRFTESQLFSSCARNFGCNHNSCSISYNYEKCSGNCDYCSSCGGCSGSTYSMDTCESGGGGNDDNGNDDNNSGHCPEECSICVENGGGKACADRCDGCSAECLSCIENGGGSACSSKCQPSFGFTNSTSSL